MSKIKKDAPITQEWTWINTAVIKALLNFPNKSERWHTVSIEMGTRFKTCLVDEGGRLWEFKIANGFHIRPMWNDKGFKKISRKIENRG